MLCSKFINALCYRKKLLDKGYMELGTIKLTDNTYEVIIKILTDSKYENKF